MSNKIITYQGSFDALVWHKQFKDLTTEYDVSVPVSHEAVFIKNGQMKESFSMGHHHLSECSFGENRLFGTADEKVDTTVYYIKKEGSYNIKWATASPVTFNDPITNENVTLDLNGVFAIKIIDAKVFLQRLLTFTKNVELDEVKLFFRERMVLYIKDHLIAVLNEHKLSVNEISTGLENVSKLLELKMRYAFESFGVVVEAMQLKQADIIKN